MKHLLLALLLVATPFLPRPAPARTNPAGTTVRDELGALYGRWGKARTAFDRATFEELLAPDFYVQIGDQRLTRQEFIDEIASARPGARLTRFDARILTLRQDHGVWEAVITEKLEFVGTDESAQRVCSLWVTKDRFARQEGAWRILSSEAVGFENWSGEEPPFPDWKS